MKRLIVVAAGLAVACATVPPKPDPPAPLGALLAGVGITLEPPVSDVRVAVGATTCSTNTQGVAWCYPVEAGDQFVKADLPDAYVPDVGGRYTVRAPNFEIHIQVTLKPVDPPIDPPPPVAQLGRHGVVRRDGKAVRDDDGRFHPLGLTFFWGLYGEKFERERVVAHFAFLAPYHFDYIRVLAEVGWPGETIDPNWPDYEQQLGRLIDDAYDLAGVRTEITVLGGGTGHDPMDVAAKVARVINDGRTEKVIALEMANESFQNGPDTATLVRMAQYFKTNTHVELIALSSAGDDAALRAAAQAAGATLYTLHTDRNGGNRKWRQVRQAWDFKDYSQVVDSNEPPGPNSSVDTNDSPLQLAMMRANGVLSGGAMFVLHVGDMVAGRVDPAHNRHANLWEVPNVDGILKAVRRVESALPDGLENWPKTTQHGGTERIGPHPLLADAIWSDGVDHGVDRAYGAVAGADFVEVLNGVLNVVTLTALAPMHVEAIDPTTGGVVATAELAAGDAWTLPGAADTMVGYVVRGHFK